VRTGIEVDLFLRTGIEAEHGVRTGIRLAVERELAARDRRAHKGETQKFTQI
jgi:hypothetical protein